MIFRDIHEKSILPKSLIMITMAVAIWISSCIMFIEKNDLVFWLQPYKTTGNFYRNVLLFSCFLIYFIRLGIMLFVFYKRKMYWIEAIIIINIMPFIIPLVAVVSGNNGQKIDYLEYAGILMFILGSYLNTYSEFLRYIWKKKKENKGHIYADGLFKYSIHINYFGDIILFSGIALIADRLILLLIPVSMALVFILILIPLKEKYLKNKYGKEFDNYAKRTRKLIPYIY